MNEINVLAAFDYCTWGLSPVTLRFSL